MKYFGIKKNFLAIDEKYSNYEDSLIAVLPVPFEQTTSYGKGTSKGPKAILDASHYVEFFDEELDRELCFEEGNGICSLLPLDFKKKKIVSTKDLYMADVKEMLGILRSVEDSAKTVFMVSHNPYITEFANSLCNYNLDNIPTSGVFCIEFDVKKWKDIDLGKGKFVSFDYPKKYYKDL